jgi:hypothetical protein
MTKVNMNSMKDTVQALGDCANPAAPEAPELPERQPKQRRRLIRWAIGLVAGLALLTVALAVAGALLHLSSSSLAGLQTGLWRLRVIGIALQLLALIVIGWRWPDVVAWAARRGWIRSSEQRAALAARTPAVLSILALIVAAGIGTGDLVRLLRAFTG